MTAEERVKEPKEKISEDKLKDLVTSELERAGSGGIFVWAIFLLGFTPNILNGFHVSSYTLLGHLPDDQWCDVRDLKTTNWTVLEQRNITQRNLTTQGCTIWDWDYQQLSKMTYTEALNYTTRLSQQNSPAEIACKVKGDYEFAAPKTTFVADWELVCDRALQRTSAQVFLSLGKFCGSFSFGIFSDKFGRKSAFTLGAVFFIVSSLFCTFTPWYSLFLVGRFGLGAASSGLFYPAITMIVENICLKHRSWMSIAFSASYPIGLIILALAAYLVESWRYLQLTLTIPALFLVLNCVFIKESPRWLLAKKRYTEAYRVLCKRKCPYEIEECSTEAMIEKQKLGETKTVSLFTKLKEGPLKQIVELFATWKMRKLIFTSYFMFCVTSLSYYVTALNASNITSNRYLYVALTGIVDIPSYIVPVVLLRFTGRRITTMALFIFTGIALLLVLALPLGYDKLVFAFAMLGRFGITSTYSIVTLYTAELYPTEIRNSALGTCSTWAHVGSISAPYVVDVLGKLGWYIPTTICGCCVLIAGLLTLTLPETGRRNIIDRVEEVPSEIEMPTEFNTESIFRKKESDK